MRRLPLFLFLTVFIFGSWPVHSVHAAPPIDPFLDPAFRAIWTRADGLVGTGTSGRSWTWGAGPGPRHVERYAESADGSRLVQYFDKARMELTRRTSGGNIPTNGLLVVEMIAGHVQHGDGTFTPATPAAFSIAGDPITGNGPTYAVLRPLATVAGDHRVPERRGERVAATLDAGGKVGADPSLATAATELVRYDRPTGHNVPRAFDDFQRALAGVTDLLGTFGYAITEPYWTTVVVGGRSTTVLLQAFERRVLTYTPTNPDPWKVEMGNVGQHYYRWRYGVPMSYGAADAGGVQVAEAGVATIQTYQYQNALVPTAPGDPIYPYSRIDRSKIGSPVPRDYRLLRLENRYLALTFLPELGGRIYQLHNKATGNNLLYENPVIKPSYLGQRGWWLGAGGMEWAAPTEEHGFLEDQRWDLRTEQSGDLARVVVSTVERQTGVAVEIAVELRADSQVFSVRGTYHNPTGAPKPFQFWMNAMVAPGAGNRLGDDLHFVVPDQQMVVHASQDPALPAPRERISWPNFGGRDLSRYRTWNGYIGLFAANNLHGKWAGVYDTGVDEGLAAVDLDPSLPGVKMFAFGKDFERSLYTDDGSDYAELWLGAQPTFWDYPELAPGATRSFHAKWQPMHGIGDFAAGTSAGAIGLSRSPYGGLILGVQPSQPRGATTMRVRAGGTELWSGVLAVAPDQPLRVELPHGVATGTLLTVEWDNQATTVAAP